jgi:hypothetical protein
MFSNTHTQKIARIIVGSVPVNVMYFVGPTILVNRYGAVVMLINLAIVVGCAVNTHAELLLISV